MGKYLFIAAGAGGDAIGAAMLAETLLPGSLPDIATMAWDRLIIDPVPGPRDAAAFEGLERIGRYNYRITPSTKPRPPAGSTLPTLAASIDANLYMQDPSQGVHGLSQQLHEIIRILDIRQVIVVDVGGDILTTGKDPGLRSPLADALSLAALQGLPCPTHIVVIGAGLDGELPAELVIERCQKYAIHSPRCLSAAVAGRFTSVFEWHPSEASGLLFAAAIGLRGTAELRDHSAQVTLDDQSNAIWEIDFSRVISLNVLAQRLVGCNTLAQAESAVRDTLRQPSEIDHERFKATHSLKPSSAKFDASQLPTKLKSIQTAAKERGTDFLTLRRLADTLKISPYQIPLLRATLHDRFSNQYIPPLWSVNPEAFE
ncbi:MAG: DUF1152 domain-containing protein [Candidatus Dormibacteraceae bacterium]